VTLRPVPARWFEVVCPRRDTDRTVALLAETGAIEVEVCYPAHDVIRSRELRDGLATYRRLVGSYARYWRGRHLRTTGLSATPRQRLRHALARIARWRRHADPRIRRIEALEAKRRQVILWRDLIAGREERHVELYALLATGPALTTVIALLPPGTRLYTPRPTVAVHLTSQGHEWLIAVAPAAEETALRRHIVAAHGRIIAPPVWLYRSAAEATAFANRRLITLERRLARLYGELEVAYQDLDLDEALGDLAYLEWFVEHVGDLPATDNFTRITGWTSDRTGDALAAALEWQGARALLHFPPPPDETHTPQLLRNPWWARPFELFTRALGIPAARDADPSPWLALVVPLLFGYMFGDVGQGLVLCACGWAIRRRWPTGRLVAAAGLGAIVGGLLFGSVFGREDVLPALWVHPLHSPLAVLGIPVGLGVLLLSLGQGLNGLQAAWQGRLSEWLCHDAGLLVTYWGAAGLVIDARFRFLALAGLAWHLLSPLWLERRWQATAAAAAALLEEGLRLVVNTVSFARVGAFALAHAGLSVTLVALADAAPPVGAVLVMVAGNLIVITLEALVVSVQTSRLVLFEFFARFVHGEGRPFRPLTPPPVVLMPELRR
jgi:V/A-type H+-transporting ATPase subunit I